MATRTLCDTDSTQTLSNKTLTGPTITGAVSSTLKQLDDNIVTIDNYASFAAAITAIGATVTTLLITKSTAVTANVTVPATLTLWFVGQGELSISVSVVVTILRRLINDDNRRIFTGSGTVSFVGNNSLREIDPLWFGAIKDGVTDDITTLQAAVTAAVGAPCRTVVADGGTFLISTALRCTGSVYFDFRGGATLKAKAGFTAITASDGNPHGVMVYVTGADVRFEQVTFDADSKVATGMMGIWTSGVGFDCHVYRCTFKNFILDGVNISTPVLFRPGGDYNRVEQCKFENCFSGAQTQGGNGVVFHDNDYFAPTSGASLDTAFGLDGGIGCQCTHNRLIYASGSPNPGSHIGVTSGSKDFLVADNTILGQRGGVGIYVWDGGVSAVSYGTIARNILDGQAYVATGTYSQIKILSTGFLSSHIIIEDNQCVNGATGAASSTAMDVIANATLVRRNKINNQSVQAGIAFRSGGGTLAIDDNDIDTNSKCIMKIDAPATNSGKIMWIRRNTFRTCDIGIDIAGAVEATEPVYFQDNQFTVPVANSVIGSRWDPGFATGTGDAGNKPHYCGQRTVMHSTVVPDGTWTDNGGAGSFKVGDIIWKVDVAAGGRAHALVPERSGAPHRRCRSS